MPGHAEIASFIKGLITKELGTPVEQIDEEITFYDLGLDSVNSIFLLGDLEDHFKVDIDPLSLYDNPTIRSFAVYIESLLDGRS